MNAVVSGQSGVAILVEGDVLSSIQTWDDEVLPRRPRDIRFLFNGAQDLQFLEDVDLEQVRERLNLESTRIDGLHTALILLDSELSHDTRRTAAEELEELLEDEGIARWVEGVLCAHPLPKSGDIVGARSACTGRTERVRAFLERLSALQGTIAEVHEAWQRIPGSYFGTAEDRQHALSIAVKEGLFRELVTSRAAGTPVDSFLDTALLNPTFKQIQDSRHILLDWVAGFQKPREAWPVVEPAASYVAERVTEASSAGVLGRHINRFELPDTFYLKLIGDVSEEEGREINRMHWEVGRHIDELFFIVDIAEFESATPATRKEAVEIQKKLAIAGVVVLKAPLKALIFAKLILTATSMFRAEKIPVVFVDTMEEARAWIDKRRVEYHASKAEKEEAAG